MKTAVPDFVSTLGTTENFGSELASITPLPTSEIAKLFPDVKLVQSDNIVYFPFKLCHSLPQVNKRGRCFTPAVLGRSFASIVHQMVNFEHLISDNFSDQKQDQIVGHVQAVRFDCPVSEIASSIPVDPMPVLGLGVLFKRCAKGKEILESYFGREQKWQVSMECGHDWNQACFLYDQKLIPIREAPLDMRNCLGKDFCLPYKGKELAVALGGTNGAVDFWGVALTTSPADKTANVFGFASGRNRELASRGMFYMPMEAVEIASDRVSQEATSKINELASITVIGETTPGGDDLHKHLILSDLTIMPASGHDHHLKNFSLDRGTDPKITGIASPHHTEIQSNNGSRITSIHTHLISISLKGKYKSDLDLESVDTNSSADSGTNSGVVYSVNSDSDYASNQDYGHQDYESENTCMKRTLKELGTLITQKTTALLSATDDAQRKSIGNEIATLNREIAEVSSQETINEEVNKQIQDRVTKGDLLTKEEAEKLRTKAVEDEKQKLTEENRIQKIRSGRLLKLAEAGLPEAFEFTELSQGDKKVTIKSLVEELPVDDTGDRQFAAHLISWKGLKDSAQEASRREAASKQQVTDNATTTQKKEATNFNNLLTLALAGGGPTGTTSAEAANAANVGGKKDIPVVTDSDTKTKRMNAGKHALSK